METGKEYLDRVDDVEREELMFNDWKGILLVVGMKSKAMRWKLDHNEL